MVLAINSNNRREPPFTTDFQTFLMELKTEGWDSCQRICDLKKQGPMTGPMIYAYFPRKVACLS